MRTPQVLGSHRLWCTETIQEVLGIDDRHVAVRGHTSLFVWDHRDGGIARDIDPRSIPRGDPAQIREGLPLRTHRAVSPDGRWIATANFGSRLRVLDAATGAMKFSEDPEYAYDAVAFSPDGATIVGTSDGAYVWAPDAVVPRRVAGLSREARIDATGDIVGGAHRGMVGRWSIDGTERARVSVRQCIESLSFSADGARAAVTTLGIGGLCMWPLPDVVVADLARGRAVLRFHDEAGVTRIAALSPDARWLALVEHGDVRLMSAAARPAWSAPPVIARWSERAEILFGPRDRALLIGEDDALELIALPGGERIAAAAGGAERRIVWSPDGRFLAELAADRRVVRFRDSSDLAIRGELELPSIVEAIAVSPDGSRLAAADGPMILVVLTGR